jgi:periplasmic divalent cation tolerance protein
MGVIIISTYPDVKSISKVAHKTVEKKLAACVNYTKINSVYSWKDKIEDTGEFLALFKTSTKSKQKLKEEIARSHPYQVPEIVEIQMDDVNESYLNWLEDSTLRGKPKKRDNPSKR